MNIFALNLVLALVWAALWSDFSVYQMVSGYLVGFGALWLAQPLFGQDSPYFRRAYRVVRLVVYFVYELVVSSIQVAWDVLTPTDLSTPKILEMPLDVESDIEILLVTNLISLTPGTLSIDITPDRKTLFVHAMFADDPDAQIAALKSGMERMVKEVFE